MENLEDNGFKAAPSAYFTGNAFFKIVVAADETTNCNISEVAFDKGCRNNWHTHPSNQILIVKEGLCLYQEEGKPIQQFKVGEAINFLPGIKHWHGASPEEPMIHFAINTNTEKGMVNWQEPVTDEQYHQQ